MQRRKKRGSLIVQVAALFGASVLIIGMLTFFAQRLLSYRSIRKQVEFLASETAANVMESVWEYPASDWLIHYWYTHADDLDIEYDVDYGPGTETEEKVRLFSERHPDIQLKYASGEQVASLPQEDQKLYAEITYSWLITRINQIKKTYNIDFVFCVLSQEPYTDQFFLFSAADEDSVRGTEYENAYILGTKATVGGSQQQAMRNAREKRGHLADAGLYADYYAYMGMEGEQDVIIGLTFNMTGLRSNITTSTKQGTGVAVAYQVLLSMIALALLAFFFIQPLKKLQESIRLYTVSKDSQKVKKTLSEIHSNNELGQLAEDISTLTEEIDQYLQDIETISAEREKMNTELSVASRIQAGMIPSKFPAFPDRKDFDLYGSMKPAREVGGDFYDFYLIDDDHLCMVIADVAGKGIPAALFMMASQISIANRVRMGLSPGKALESSNDAFIQRNKGELFVTIWLGILELSTGKLIAANAGHEYPVIKHGNGQYELFKDPHSFVVGGMEGIHYKEYELQLEPGSKLFLYTDGVPEATDTDEQLFGTERMLSVLNQDISASPEQTLKNMTEAIDAFVGEAEQFDDVTMLCVEYKGTNTAGREDL